MSVHVQLILEADAEVRRTGEADATVHRGECGVVVAFERCRELSDELLPEDVPD